MHPQGSFYLFSIAGIPVYASGWVFLLIAFWVFTSGSIVRGMVWGSCLLFSVLVHELGHGLVSARLALSPTIVLHGWGGYTSHRQATTRRQQVAILVAGPGAGFALAAVSFGASSILNLTMPGWQVHSSVLASMLSTLVFVNVFWSLFNLLPIWPLDGGQLMKIAVTRKGNTVKRSEFAHRFSIGAAVLGAVGSVVFFSSFLMAILFGLMVMENNRAMAQGDPNGSRPVSQSAIRTLDEARAALAAGDVAEAIRLCHVFRGEKNVDAASVTLAWTILCVASHQTGAYDDCVRYGRRAAKTPEVLEARIRSLIALGRVSEARDARAEPGYSTIPARARAEIESDLG